MEHVELFLREHTVLLILFIIVVSFVAYVVVKRLARLALFLLVSAVVAYLILHWVGRI
jgi:hypothetical protein